VTVTIRSITPEEVPLFRRSLVRGFGDDLRPEHEAEDRERFLAVIDLSRAIAAFDDGAVIGTAATHALDLSVPGGTVPMGGLAMVTVRPTHRRRGTLRHMMQVHLDDVRDRGEAVSGLWASESSIYGRFGYGVAVEHLEIAFDARMVGLPSDETVDDVELIEAEEAAAVLPGLYAAAAKRPGMLGRSDAWWQARKLPDPEHRREGRSARRYAVARRGGAPVGYASFRQAERWEHSIPEGTVDVAEVVALDDDARLTLWRFLAGIDLFPKVAARNVPVDFELLHQVRDPRRIRRTLHDGLYLRIVDVAAALEARAYAADGEVVLALEGDDGGYRLEAAAGRATCTRSSADPDLVLDVAALSSLYLGSGNAPRLHRAGRIAGDAAAVDTLHRLLAWPVAAWCPDMF
jgi:predicted acetyltransferase